MDAQPVFVSTFAGVRRRPSVSEACVGDWNDDVNGTTFFPLANKARFVLGVARRTYRLASLHRCCCLRPLRAAEPVLAS